jgi:hypothetical protein
MLSIKLDNLSQTLAGLSALPVGMHIGFSGALKDWGEDVMERSKQIVPVGKTGKLKDSGKVGNTEMQNGQIVLNLGYGDHQAWYATIVHERLDVRHPNGQAKYLETPISENASRLDSAMSEALYEAVRSSLRAA